MIEKSSSGVVEKYSTMKKILSMFLSQLNFQSKVNEFLSDFIYKYDAKIIKNNQQESKVVPTDKGSLFYLFPLYII